MRFEWDQCKAKANLNKHGVSFEDAVTVFNDPRARLILDLEHSENEDRYWVIGISAAARILLVCHCYRREDVVRVLSARRATSAEMKLYP